MLRQPNNDELQQVREALGTALADESYVRRLVRAYFDPEGPFAGSTFDALGPDTDPSEVSEADLLAVSLLDVRFTPLAVRRLLTSDGGIRKDVGAALESITSTATLWEADDADLRRADELWNFLIEGLPGVGPVIAGKLLARKRPHLIPIWDEAISRMVPLAGDSFWLAIRDGVTGDLLELLERQRPEVRSSTSLLRILDATLWMMSSGSENAKRARANARDHKSRHG